MEENHSYLVQLLQEEADRRGITLEQALDEIERNIEIVNTPLMPHRRLYTVESMLQEGCIGPNQADVILQKNHVLQKEIRDLVGDIAAELEGSYGIRIPRYGVFHDERLNPQGFTTGVGLTDWRTKTITLPTEGEKSLPVIVAHELGHAYQMENSRLWWQLRSLDKCRDRYDAKREESSHLIDGWANFVVLLHARQRDERLGVSMYEDTLREVCGLQALLDASNGTDRKGYYVGLQLFEKIFERDGFEGARHAATVLTSDAELREYARGSKNLLRPPSKY